MLPGQHSKSVNPSVSRVAIACWLGHKMERRWCHGVGLPQESLSSPELQVQICYLLGTLFRLLAPTLLQPV